MGTHQHHRTSGSPILDAARSGDLATTERLLADTGDSNPETYQGIPLDALAGAVYGGQMGVLRELMSRGADIHAHDRSGTTPLHHAATGRQMEVARFPLENGLDPNARSARGRTPFHIAAAQRHREMVDLMLHHGAVPDLCVAVGMGDLAMAESLIAAGADVNACGPQMAPLHWATALNQTAIAKLLLGHGAEVDPRASDGSTPLRSAALHYRRDVCELLLRRGADPNAVDDDGQTPLYGTRYDIMELLLAHGARVDVRDNDGLTPLHREVYSGPWIPGYSDGRRRAELLISHGAEIDLHIGAGLGDIETVRSILGGGADVDARINYGETPLHWATMDGQADMVEYLLERGADSNAEDDDGDTPLHELATVCDYMNPDDLLRIAESLLARGADVNARAVNGISPLGLTKGKNSPLLADWLRAHGAHDRGE